MKKLLRIILICTVIFGITACSRNTQITDSPSVTPTSRTEDTDEDKAGTAGSAAGTLEDGNHYPVTITNYNYAKDPVEITFEEAPKKVLAVYQNSIETLLALGLENRITAASGLDHTVKPEYEKAFSKINYLTEFAPDKETVIMMEPDFILSWHSFFGEKRLGEVDYWQEKGINTYMSLNSGAVQNRTLENEYTDILNLGRIFDVEEKAEAIVNEMKEEVSRVVAHASESEEKRSVMIIEFLDDTITVYGENSLGGDMVLQLGGDLISIEGGTIGDEDLISFNPNVVFVVYMDKEGEDMAAKSLGFVTKNPVFASLNAVVNDNVHTIQLGEMYCSGVRTMDGINVFAAGIYPELY